MVNENVEKDHGIDEGPSASQVPENKLRHNFRLGDITWVKLNGSSWWPAQVMDESCVGSKPKKKDKHDCLVRLYGTCQYLYVDPWKSNSEFEMMLKQEDKSAMEAFREVLEKELSCDNSPTDYDEEAVNSKGSSTKGTSKKNSSRKDRKQEGTKPQCNEEEDQNVTAQKRKGGCLKRSYDAIDKDMIDREHHAEMAYVDEVINGICGAAEDIMSGGQGIKQSGNNGVKGESSNARQRCGDEVTSPQTKKGNTGSSGEDTGAT